MPPGGPYALRDALAVEDSEHAPEPVRRRLSVGEPPRHRDPPAVRIDELHPRAVVQTVLRMGPADAGLLDSTPRRLARPVGVRGVVRPDGPGLEPRRNSPGALRIARPDARAQAERRVVREPHCLVLGVERLHRHDGAEDLLAL